MCLTKERNLTDRKRLVNVHAYKTQTWDIPGSGDDLSAYLLCLHLLNAFHFPTLEILPQNTSDHILQAGSRFGRLQVLAHPIGPVVMVNAGTSSLE